MDYLKSQGSLPSPGGLGEKKRFKPVLLCEKVQREVQSVLHHCAPDPPKASAVITLFLSMKMA